VRRKAKHGSTSLGSTKVTSKSARRRLLWSHAIPSQLNYKYAAPAEPGNLVFHQPQRGHLFKEIRNLKNECGSMGAASSGLSCCLANRTYKRVTQQAPNRVVGADHQIKKKTSAHEALLLTTNY